VLTDSMMPEMGGAELVKRVRKDRPDIGVLMMSGYTEHLVPTDAISEDHLFIEKPFTTADLLLGIRSALKN